MKLVKLTDKDDLLRDRSPATCVTIGYVLGCVT